MGPTASLLLSSLGNLEGFGYLNGIKCGLTTQLSRDVIQVSGSALDVLREVLPLATFGEKVKCPNRGCFLCFCSEEVDCVVEACDCDVDDQTRAKQFAACYRAAPVEV